MHADGVCAIADALVINTSLTELALYGNPIGRQGLGFLKMGLERQGKLTKLDLWGCHIGIEGPSSMSHFLSGAYATRAFHAHTGLYAC